MLELYFNAQIPFQACLEIMGLYGANKAAELAEVVGGAILAAELSLATAIISDDFAKAHQMLARWGTNVSESDSLLDVFEIAATEVMKVPQMPSRDTLMKIYGCYKQAACGDVNVAKPSLFSTDLKARAKWYAWAAHKGQSREDAMREYIKLVCAVNPNFKTSKPVDELRMPLPKKKGHSAASSPEADDSSDVRVTLAEPTLTTNAVATAQNEEQGRVEVRVSAMAEDFMEELPLPEDIDVPSTPTSGAPRDEVEELKRQLQEMAIENERLQRKIEDMKRPLEQMRRQIFGSE